MRRNHGWLFYLGFALGMLWLLGKAMEAAKEAFAHPRYKEVSEP